MTTCARCDGELRDGAAFCRHCGADQRTPDPDGGRGTVPSAGAAPGATCSRCGAALRPGGRFCRECGKPVDDPADEPDRPGDADHAATVVDGPPPAAPPEPHDVPTAATAPSPAPDGDATLVDPGPSAARSPTPAAANGGSGGDRRTLLLVGGALLVIAVAVVLALSLGSGGGKGTPQRASSPGTTGTRGSTAPRPPSSTSDRGDGTKTATTTPGRPATAPTTRLTATIDRTCGSDGRADCFVSVRAQPSAGAQELRRLSEGASVRIVCQVTGSSTYSSVLGSSTTLWSRTSSGGYVTNAYLSGPRINPTSRSLPRC